MEPIAADSNAEQAFVEGLLRRGCFREVAAFLQDRNDVRSLLDRAWITIFYERNVEAAAELAGASLAKASSAKDVLLARALLEFISASAGKAERHFDIGDFADVAPNVSSRAIYWIAYAAFLRSNFSQVEMWLRVHKPATPAMRARYLALEGALRATEDQAFDEQLRLTTAAIELLESEAPDETYLLARYCHILAHLLREVPAPDALIRLEKIDASIDWSDGVEDERFQARRALAWAYAVRGQLREGLTVISRATSDSRNVLMQIFGHLDFAHIAIFANQRICANVAFDVADDLANRINWRALPGDHHIAALTLAAEAASELSRHHAARKYIDLAEELQRDIVAELALALRSGGRLTALIASARAISLADFDRGTAVQHASDAYGIFASIGYAWRAGRMALLLHQLTRKDEWRARADEHLAHFPNNPFSRLLEPGKNRRTLTKRQADVLRLIQLGYDDVRIADELGIKEGTVRIHIGHLFAFFGAKNRSQLAVISKEGHTAAAERSSA